jgi:hypothetical protein
MPPADGAFESGSNPTRPVKLVVPGGCRLQSGRPYAPPIARLPSSIMLARIALRFGPASPRLRVPVAIVAIWSVVAVVAAIQAAALVRLHGRADVVGAIASRVSIIPLWALATPFILRSARRFPVVGLEWRPDPFSLVAHLALGSLFILVTNFVIRVPILFGSGSHRAFDALVQSTLQGVAEYYPPAIVVYGVIVALGHARWWERPAAASETAVATAPAVPEAEPRPALAANPGAELGAEPRIAADDTTPDSNESGGETPLARVEGHLTVRQWNRVHLVRVEDIDWIEAQDNYVVVHAASRSYKGRERISDVEVQLDPHRFVRIHRSTIVQTAKIREVQPLTHGDHAVILREGTVLRVARSRRQALAEALGLEL